MQACCSIRGSRRRTTTVWVEPGTRTSCHSTGPGIPTRAHIAQGRVARCGAFACRGGQLMFESQQREVEAMMSQSPEFRSLFLNTANSTNRSVTPNWAFCPSTT